MKRALQLNDSVRHLNGVGEVRATALAKMGIHTIRDLVRHFPRGYENRGNIRLLTEGTDGAKSAFLLTVGTVPKTVRLKGRLTITKFRAFDESGTIDVVFYNQDYVRQVFQVGSIYRFWGTLNQTKSKWTLSSPAYEPYRPNGSLPDYISVYSANSAVNGKILQGLIDMALAVPIEDYLPEDIRLRNHLPTLSWALKQIHHPDTPVFMELALKRLVFDELFCMSVAVSANRSRESLPRVPSCSPVDLSPLLLALPYQLTGAQKRVVEEFKNDLISPQRTPVSAMRRILIGDVGSGKTVCAMAAMYTIAKNGYQVALMAPTEILATQHYHDIAPLFKQLGIQTELLLGSTSAKEKRRIYAGLIEPEAPISVVIGTHALLNNKVEFSKLLLTITDEQHRFGIEQRNALSDKASAAHLLVMSATPIPRSLALALYGDLSISRLDEMPPGRQKVDTFVVNESFRERLNGFIEKQVEAGGQVYVVCPAIEEQTEDVVPYDADEVPLTSMQPTRRRPMKNVQEYAQQLQAALPHITIGTLHGKMKSAEKEAIMNGFVGGDIQVLISTTVIEVGVNVPNACLMVIENAENFGLSQLHQLRGRVGRGNRKSYCILVSNFTGDIARQRLDVMTKTNDGYEIAERDLALRGPGDFFSSACNSEMRQSGGFNLRLAKCCDDPSLMHAAFQEAAAYIQKDPQLTLPESAPIREELTYYFNSTENSIS